MNRLRKVSAFITAAFVIAAFFIIPAGAAMTNPIAKFNGINSMTSKTDITINLSANGLTQQDQESFDVIQPIIDDMRISTVSKFERNADRTISNQYMHLMMMAGGTPFDTSIWAKADLTGKIPLTKEIVRIPKTLSDYLPADVQGKEYAVVDLGKLTDIKLNTSKLSAASNKLMDAVTNSVTSMPAGLLPIKDRGTGTLNTPTGVVKVHNYTLKLDDATLKLLVKYSVNNLAANKDVITALKDYVIAANAKDDKEARVLSNEFDKEMPGFVKDFNTSLDGLKDTKLVGEKGIVINYSINSDGYIVNTNGIINLVVKASTLNQLETLNNASQVSKDNGEYNLTVKFNSTMYNINKGTKVVFPYLDKKNSFDLYKAMEDMNNIE